MGASRGHKTHLVASGILSGLGAGTHRRIAVLGDVLRATRHVSVSLLHHRHEDNVYGLTLLASFEPVADIS